jgi:hypothetical protein
VARYEVVAVDERVFRGSRIFCFLSDCRETLWRGSTLSLLLEEKVPPQEADEV